MNVQQIVNEFEEMLEIEQERAKERTRAKGNQHEGKETFPDDQTGQARDKAAEKIDANVSGRTLEKGLEVKEKAESEDEPDEVRETAQEAWEKLESGEETFSGARDEVKKVENKVEKEQKRESEKEQFKEAVADAEAVQVDAGEFQSVLGDVPDGTYDHIVTDPPYDEKAVAEWEALAETAARVLKPGGLLVAYSGKYHLPDVYDALGRELDYYWQFIVKHSGAGARVWPRNIRTNYKPIIVYAKPPVEKLDGLGHDVIEGAGVEKDAHDWQQAEAEAVGLLEQLTEPNDYILDPMCGSGTTGVAALGAGRRVHLIDRDPEAVESARRRCHDVL